MITSIALFNSAAFFGQCFTAGINITNVSCNGMCNGILSTSTKNGSGQFTYIWSTGGTSASLNNLCAGGSFTVTITDAVNTTCTQTVAATITEPAAIVIVPTSTPTTCGLNNGCAYAAATGGTGVLSYNWTGGGTGQTSCNLSPGTYKVTVTDANGCSTSTAAIVNSIAPPQPVVTINTSLLCNGDKNGSVTVTALGGTPQYTYSWSSGGTGTTENNLSAGFYVVTVTDASSCMSVVSVTLTEPTKIILTNSIAKPSCNTANGSAVVFATGGTPGYSYSWSTGATDATINNIAAGSYTVTVTDANACAVSTVIIVNNNTNLTVTAAGSTLSCNGDKNGSAVASATGGVGQVTYTWSNGATGQTASNLPGGVYVVTVTDANSCAAVTNVTVVEPSVLVPHVTAINTACGTSNGNANVYSTGGTPGYTNSWSTGATGPAITGLAVGSYAVTVTDSKGCVKVEQFTIGGTANAGTVSATVQSNAKCNGAADGVAVASYTGGTSPYTFTWNTGATGATASNLAAGTYFVTGTDAGGCSASGYIVVSQPNPVIANIAGAPTTCGTSNGSAYVLPVGGTGSYTFTWTNGATSQTISNVSAGSYSVTVTDANGCTKSTSYIVLNIGAGTVSFTKTNVSCNGGADGSAVANITGGTPNYTYSWSTGSTSQTATNLSAGTSYTVTITDANSCMNITSVSVTEPKQIKLTQSVATPSCGTSNGSAVVFVNGGIPQYSYSWSTGATTATVNSIAAGSYTVTVTDANACTNSLVIVVQSSTAPVVQAAVTPTQCGAAIGAITANVTGGVPNYTYLWSNGATTSGINNLQAGSYSVTVTDANGCQGISIAVVNCVTGIAQNVNALSMSIYPNPSNGTFVIESKFEKADKTVISLTNILGETVMLIDNVQQAGVYKKQVNIEHLSGGIYFLVVQQNNERLVKKIINQ